MGYELIALIATAPVVRPLTAELTGATLVSLDQGMELLPLTDDIVDTFTGGACEEWEEGFALPSALAERVAHHSRTGPIAYVEADFFGGTGSQDVRVWRDGVTVLELHEDARRFPRPTTPSPISRALRLLGVRSTGRDEFDAVGLGRRRHTEDWFASPGQ